MILVDNRNTTDPYVNLAIEEFLIRHTDCEEKDYVLFYVNEPSIVLGKNQSIWKEINFEYLRNGKLKLCRRISGGGTVYHDTGNLSFAFISKFAEEKINNYKLFNQPIVNALRKAGVKAEMDARNNILCNGKKFSGSAQFTNRKNIISHGTILLKADLNTLRSCLKENDFTVETKAVGSVKSSVINISEVTDKFSSVENLKIYLTLELQASEVYTFSNDEWSLIERLADEKFRTFEWVYGRSPHTKITKNEMEIEIEEGKIASGNLVGIFYQYEAIKKALGDSPNASEFLKQIF